MGACHNRWAAPWSVTKVGLTKGSASAGRRVKKSRERRPDDRLPRRKWSEPTASSAAHLGTSRADTGPPVSLPLENAVGPRRRHRLELLLPDLRRSDQVRADQRVS